MKQMLIKLLNHLTARKPASQCPKCNWEPMIMDRDRFYFCELCGYTTKPESAQREEPDGPIHEIISTEEWKKMQVAAPVQTIRIKHDTLQINNDSPVIMKTITIDGYGISDNGVRLLAANEGLETLKAFWAKYPTDFDGVIIHKTAFRY